ncbi:Mbeg1-like protein, partial [Desulfobacula phenolica]
MGLYSILLSLLLLSGCALPTPIGKISSPREYNYVSEHEVTDSSQRKNGESYDSPRFLSCDKTMHPYTGNVEIAKETFLFALMASNAYRVEAQFDIPGWKLVKHYRGALSGNYESAFQADLYERKQNNVITEVSLVFRGTDSGVDHTANFALWWPWSKSRIPSQYQIAERLAYKIRNLYPNAKLYFVGHSLGGGLAYHASWNIDGAITYVFDPSPRLWVDGTPAKGRRIIVREKGEILEYIQFWNHLISDNEESYNFISGSAVREHNMYYLARGLLLLSAMHNSELADRIMEDNLGCSRYKTHQPLTNKVRLCERSEPQSEPFVGQARSPYIENS